MKHMPDLLESRLVAAYTEQAQHYERALAIIADASTLVDDGKSDAWIHELADALGKVASCDATVAHDKLAWQQLGETPGPELREILTRVAEQVRSLSAHIDGRIADLLARRQRFIPEIEAFSKQRQMLQAYESNCPTASET